MADVPIRRISNVISYTVGTTAYKGVKSVPYKITETVKESNDVDNSPGLAAQDKVQRRLEISPEFESDVAETILDEAEANVTVVSRMPGSSQTHTTVFKNVLHRNKQFSSTAVSDGKFGSTSGITGVCTWGSSDTLATMITKTYTT